MYTFIISVIFGILVSWCVFGKNFNRNLFQVALTIISISFVSTIIVSLVFINGADTEKIFVEQSKITPIDWNILPKDTIVVIIKDNNDSILSTKYSIINDTIPNYFSLKDTNGLIRFKTDYTSDGWSEDININNLELVLIDSTSWYGIEKTIYSINNRWVTTMSLPHKDKKHILFLNKEHMNQLKKLVNKYECSDSLIIAQNGK